MIALLFIVFDDATSKSQEEITHTHIDYYWSVSIIIDYCSYHLLLSIAIMVTAASREVTRVRRCACNVPVMFV